MDCWGSPQLVCSFRTVQNIYINYILSSPALGHIPTHKPQKSEPSWQLWLRPTTLIPAWSQLREADPGRIRVSLFIPEGQCPAGRWSVEQCHLWNNYLRVMLWDQFSASLMINSSPCSHHVLPPNTQHSRLSAQVTWLRLAGGQPASGHHHSYHIFILFYIDWGFHYTNGDCSTFHHSATLYFLKISSEQSWEQGLELLRYVWDNCSV